MEYDCTTHCKSEIHGNLLCSAVTKRGVSDEELCSFLDCSCKACGQVRDLSGCTLLHMAASTGRTKVCHWLVLSKGANINIKDLESGYTPLHRSIFYGKIDTAVQLIQLGANISTVDNDNLTPLEHSMKDIFHKLEFSPNVPCQMYVWGSNTNYTLGTEKRPNVPEHLDNFHKQVPHVSVKQVCMHKYHSVIVSSDGGIYACGHGQGGRLGLNTESTVMSPQKINIGGICIQASISRDHSLFLLDSGQVWVCGLNTFGVLGLRPSPPMLLIPKNLPNFKIPIEGVCCGRFHSVAWGRQGLFTWGLNGGQLGHDKTNSKVIFPKFVNMWADTELKLVAASDGATVVITQKGDIYVLHEFQCRKIASKQINVTKAVVHGGYLDSKLDNVLTDRGGKELKVIVLTNVGNILLWQESAPQLTRCIFSNRPLIVTDINLNHTQLVFVTNTGEGYYGDIKLKKKKPTESSIVNKQAFHDFLNKEDCHVVKVYRLPNIHRAVSISTDPKGRNFAVLQADPRNSLINLPEVSASEYYQQTLSLLKYCDTADSIHDVVFQVSGQLFPAHRYVIAKSSDSLLSIMEACTNERIPLANVTANTFRQILQFMYSGTCDLLDPNSSTAKFDCTSNSSSKNNRDPVRTLQEAAKRFGVTALYKLLDCYGYADRKAFVKSNRKVEIFRPKFERAEFAHLHDVEILVRNDKKLSAHKCILAARLEYFNNLFATRWNEDQVRTSIKLPMSLNVLEAVIDYLYTDIFDSTNIAEDLDFLCNVLAVANQLFVTRLKETCELLISSRLNLKNIVNILEIAAFHNANQLKACCMEFICLNLTCLMESLSLDNLDDDVLKELSDYYCSWNRYMATRVITPYSHAPDDETVLAVKDHQPSKQFTPEAKKKRARRSANQRTRLESGNSISEDVPFVVPEYTPEKIVNTSISPVSSSLENNRIKMRLRAIESAKNILTRELSFEEECFTNLNLSAANDFPELGGNKSAAGHPNSKSTTTQKPSESIKIKPTKISQKQRKRLSSTSEVLATSPTSPTQKTNPWNMNAMTEHLNESTTTVADVMVNTKKKNMVDIIADEKKQKQNWTKMTSKPLMYTQMEDKAIAELHRFYSTDLAQDELISIERIEAQATAAPVWIK